MNLMEILLLLAGITIFVISFLVPLKKEELQEETKNLAKEEIKELVNQEMTHVRTRVEDEVDDTINAAVEKTERFMDRVSNEKMMAINEYSDTVMEDIHKSHTEVMFLYDMLNDKYENLKVTAAEVDKTIQEVKNTSEELTKKNETIEAKPVKTEQSGVQRVKETVNQKLVVKPENKPKQAPAKPIVQKPQAQKVKEPVGSLQGMEMENRNEEILKLHREGKSNVAIARELGMGVGEVKLVIGLFEGIQ